MKVKKQKTTSLKAKDIHRQWHFIDGEGQIVGRLASRIALLLMGKNKPNYVSYLDNGDFVVVQNAARIKFSGNKINNKIYYHHTGYPKGLRERSAKWMFEHQPERVLLLAVKNMLPKNKHRQARLRRLKIYVDENHPYKNNFTKIKEKGSKNDGQN